MPWPRRARVATRVSWSPLSVPGRGPGPSGSGECVSKGRSGGLPRAWRQPRCGRPCAQAPRPRASGVCAVGGGAGRLWMGLPPAGLRAVSLAFRCAHSSTQPSDSAPTLSTLLCVQSRLCLSKEAPQASQTPLRKGLGRVPPGRGARGSRACTPAAHPTLSQAPEATPQAA